MRYPDFIKIGDTIGITAPSAGITKKEDWLRLDNVKNNFGSLGYKVRETEDVRKCELGRSADAKKRAEEFMELWNDENISAIIMATGGDFLAEILEYLDFNKISKSKLKWIQGYSNITVISFVFTTMLDIATIYGPNVKAYGMRNLYKNLTDSIRMLEGKDVIQESFEKCEDKNLMCERVDPLEEYKLEVVSSWKSLNGDEFSNFSGRSIGGCMDDILNLIGTKYDFVNQYIEKYKYDGIVWFLEVYEMSSSQVMRNLWQMKSAGYFENCRGIIFGRPLFVREDYGVKFYEAVLGALKDLNIPIIYDIDIGHVAPQMSVVNGAIIDVVYEKGKGKIKTIFE